METLKLRARDGLDLNVSIFHVEKARGIVQIIHGAKEYHGRYEAFAKYLQAQGFVVIASDNRGHGHSVNEDYPLGYMNHYEEILADQYLVTCRIKEEYPGLPLYLFGHSLGSVFARLYIQKYDAEIEKLILSGTVNYVPGVAFGIFLGNLVIKMSGPHGYQPFLESLSLKNQKDDLWISLNEENLAAYRRDPLCQYLYQNQAVVTIFNSVRQLKQTKAYDCKNPNLEILSISGDGDPITGGEKGLKHSIRLLERAGYSRIKHIVYPGMNHEVLNEDDKETVYDDVLRFLLA